MFGKKQHAQRIKEFGSNRMETFANLCECRSSFACNVDILAPLVNYSSFLFERSDHLSTAFQPLLKHVQADLQIAGTFMHAIPLLLLSF